MAQKKNKKKAAETTTEGPLGKGLSSLISSDSANFSGQGFIPNLPVEYISPNPHQPRMSIKPEDLIEISDSIRENGVIQPLIVTKRGDKDYVLIAGERRLKAAQLASVKTVPVVVREASQRQMLELAVVENIQRQDLNPLEEALAFKQLYTKFNMKHEEIGKKVGYSRVAVVNKIRLLRLPEKIKQLILDGVISEGHGRALLGIDDEDAMIAAADIVVKKKLNVHECEDLVRRVVQGIDGTKGAGGRPRRLSQDALKIEENLGKYFDTKIEVMKLTGGRGKITIRYKSEDHLKEIAKKIMD